MSEPVIAGTLPVETRPGLVTRLKNGASAILSYVDNKSLEWANPPATGAQTQRSFAWVGRFAAEQSGQGKLDNAYAKSQIRKLIDFNRFGNKTSVLSSIPSLARQAKAGPRILLEDYADTSKPGVSSNALYTAAVNQRNDSAKAVLRTCRDAGLLDELILTDNGQTLELAERKALEAGRNYLLKTLTDEGYTRAKFNQLTNNSPDALPHEAQEAA